MMPRHRPRLLALAASLFATSLACAQTYPSRPITIVVPWPPGAATDATTRIIAEALGKELGQPVTVENRAGANGSLGAAARPRRHQPGWCMEDPSARSRPR